MALISDIAWHEALGAAVGKIGSPEFSRDLLNLFGRVLSHDMAVIAQYSRNSPVEILHFEGLPRETVELFRLKYYDIDPFYGWWRARGEPGVVTQRMVTPDKESDPYSRLFQRQAGISDEIGMFMPGIGGDALALFLERVEGRFSPADLRRARSIYPVLAGLYRAHTNRLVSELGRMPGEAKPRLFLDRQGAPVLATEDWMKVQDEQAVRAALRSVAGIGAASKGHADIDATRVLTSEPLPPDFPVAPRGRVLVIEERGRPPLRETSGRISRLDFGAELTQREISIIELVLKGYPNERIARQLGISRGTVKNHRLRIYYKLDITSERELFLRYLDVLRASA